MNVSECKQCQRPKFEKDLISILCPTRERPENIVRLVESILKQKSKSGKVEILIFIDDDDDSYPDKLEEEYNECLKIIRGPRQWISNAHNILYNFAKGEILMTAGDDMIFETQDWDKTVLSKFQNSQDKILLVFGDDRATHSGKIAIHGFFHQHWVHVLGTWVQPGRGSAWDFWSSENARLLGRLEFVPDLIISHIHFRQGKKIANFDRTYERVYLSNKSFRPELTFKKMERERRIDRILLRQAMLSKPPIERNYWLGERLNLFLTNLDQNRLLSMKNYEIIFSILAHPLRTLSRNFGNG